MHNSASSSATAAPTGSTTLVPAPPAPSTNPFQPLLRVSIPIGFSQTSSTDQLLLKCRQALETQSRELDREKSERYHLTKQMRDLDDSLSEERASHHLVQNRLLEAAKKAK